MNEYFEVGDIFNNYIEVVNNHITVEIMAIWVDEDDDVYYIIKCREVARNEKGEHGPSWMWEGDIELISHGQLYKYYSKGRHNG